MPGSARLAALDLEVTSCRACPRLVAWREAVAARPSPRYAGQSYWGRPVTGLGDPGARLLVVGLAPAAHGGNRTGRVFTGDRSGDFLFRAMFRCGFANQAESTHLGDGLRLVDAYVSPAVRCAPPANRPTPEERDRCAPYLVRELELLEDVRVIVVLGAFAYEATWRALRAAGVDLPRPRPRFAHRAEVPAGAGTLLCSFHPSQQNTFTGRLTDEMLESVFRRAAELIARSPGPRRQPNPGGQGAQTGRSSGGLGSGASAASTTTDVGEVTAVTTTSRPTPIG